MIGALVAVMALAKVKVACVGDSITFGSGTSDPKTRSYPAVLQQLLGDRYDVRNFGHGGTRMMSETELPYVTVPEYAAAKAFLPEIVVIKLGTNDAWHGEWPKLRDRFVPDARALIASFVNLPSHPKVYVSTPAPICFAPADAARRILEDETLPLLKQAARESGVPVIDVFTPLSQHPELFPDGVHPNDAGAARLAEEIWFGLGVGGSDKSKWRVVSFSDQQSSEGAAADAIDGDPETYWHTQYDPTTIKHPHEIVIDLGDSLEITGFTALPRQDGGVNGRIRKYEFYASSDTKNWGKPVATGEFTNSREVARVRWDGIVTARYVKLVALSEWNGGPWTSLAEFDVIRRIGG